MRLGVAVVAFFVLLVGGAECKQMELIKIGRDGKSFVLASSGKPFVPRGFNYDRDDSGRLLEDYWDTEWPTVHEDLAEMKTLGANVVRIHLQFGRFMLSPDKANEKALDRLELLVSDAESLGLYLDITGLACYKKEHIPDWYDGLSEKDRWRAQAVFWEAVAKKCADHPGVFCYDIMNEPVVPSGRREDWLGAAFAEVYYYVQFISLDRRDRPRTDISREWLKVMVSAIRKHDKRHLITVGLLPCKPGDDPESGFAPKTVAPEVDFLSVHIYPESTKLHESLDILKAFDIGKPVVIEETFPMHCSVMELQEFLTKSEGHAAGWIGFYWGKTIEECRKSGSWGNTVMVAWLELLQQMTKPSAD
ncbi:MAG: cellulase family glycosylhydrolase [Armatimonadetes bacterium]|nr:cellulase family glycosylhydrolase [Armatimonadota bacterium]